MLEIICCMDYAPPLWELPISPRVLSIWLVNVRGFLGISHNACFYFQPFVRLEATTLLRCVFDI